jgi:hypothetical protein
MPRIVIAAIAGLLAGLAFIASNVVAQHNPLPHQVKVAAAGVDAGRLQETLDRATPGGYRVIGVAGPPDAVRSVTAHDAVGALVVSGGRAGLLTASAGGYNAATTVQQALAQAAKALELPSPAPRDVVPLQKGDPRGLSLQQIVLGTIIGGFLMGLLSAQIALGEPFALRALVTVAFGVAFGGIAALLLDPVIGVLTGHFLWIWLWLGAAAFAIAEVARGFARALGLPGIGLAMLILLIVGNPSAAANTPISFLPAFYRTFGPWLPPNAAAQGLLGTTYFDADVTRPALVLGAWAVLGLGSLWLLDRVQGRRPGLAVDAARATARPEPARR